jgi:aminoglycoside phosphotransferase (APT) family kinase protein
LVVTDDRIEAILDWEMANLGDPARDLGIATMAEWGLWWHDQELLDRYREGGGVAIDPESLRWWRCLGYAMVVAFLSQRAASGWDGAPSVDRFTAGLTAAHVQWREAAS